MANAPQSMQISWGSHMEYVDWRKVLTLSPLIRLRAHCPTLTYTFGIHALEEEAEDSLDMTCDDHDSDTYKVCGCAYLEAWELEEQSAYTEAIKVLLNHDNVAWLEEIRRGKANVVLRVDYPFVDIGIDFLETPDDLLQEDIYDGAKKYINSRDILNMWPERLAIVELAFHIAKPGHYKTT
jgi:hypothetical protein